MQHRCRRLAIKQEHFCVEKKTIIMSTSYSMIWDLGIPVLAVCRDPVVQVLLHAGSSALVPLGQLLR
jgi:hypothetical protein